MGAAVVAAAVVEAAVVAAAVVVAATVVTTVVGATVVVNAGTIHIIANKLIKKQTSKTFIQYLD